MTNLLPSDVSVSKVALDINEDQQLYSCVVVEVQGPSSNGATAKVLCAGKFQESGREGCSCWWAPLEW